MYKLPAVIFAGGKSSRMGRDKAHLTFGGYPSLSQYQYVRLEKLFEKVYLSAKSDKFDFDAPVIEDKYEVHSPLAGLVSVFETLQCDAVFILSVDAPFVGEKVIERVMEHIDRPNDIIAAQSPEGVEPLCAIYKRSVLPKAKAMLEANNHRMTDLLEAVETQKVLFEEREPFLNLNHPEEYEEALRLL
jgi:molybdopterin-guanine dinucleotide biosynthesis protein A